MEVFPGISMDPDVRFGKPCLTGTRIDVATIVGALAAGESADTLATDYRSALIRSVRPRLRRTRRCSSTPSRSPSVLTILLDENFPLGLVRVLETDGLHVEHVIPLAWRGASDIRALFYEPGGRKFESCRAHQPSLVPTHGCPLAGEEGLVALTSYGWQAKSSQEREGCPPVALAEAGRLLRGATPAQPIVQNKVPSFSIGRCGLPQLLIRDVQVALRCLDVGVREHHLDDPDLDAVRGVRIECEARRQQSRFRSVVKSRWIAATHANQRNVGRKGLYASARRPLASARQYNLAANRADQS